MISIDAIEIIASLYFVVSRTGAATACRLRAKGPSQMTPERVEQAIAGGYEIVVTESDTSLVPRGSTYCAIADFEHSLNVARVGAEPNAMHTVVWQLQTRDELIMISGYAVIAGEAYVDVCEHLQRACAEILRAPRSYGVAASVAAKVISYMADVLRAGAIASCPGWRKAG